jgi:hypothetical protein
MPHAHTQAHAHAHATSSQQHNPPPLTNQSSAPFLDSSQVHPRISETGGRFVDSVGGKSVETGGNRLVMDQGARSVDVVVNGVLDHGGKFLDTGGNYGYSSGVNSYSVGGGGYSAGVNGYSAGASGYSAGVSGYSAGSVAAGGGYTNLNIQMAPNVIMHGNNNNKLASLSDQDDIHASGNNLSNNGNHLTTGRGTLTAGGFLHHNHNDHINHKNLGAGNVKNSMDVRVTKRRVSSMVDLERWTSDSPKLIEGESEEARAERYMHTCMTVNMHTCMYVNMHTCM